MSNTHHVTVNSNISLLGTGLVSRPADVSNLLSLSSFTSVNFKEHFINPNWLRWVHASICTHFDTYKTIYPLYIEGDERTTGDNAEFAELRVDGPLIKIPQKGLFYLDYDINILIQSHMDPNSLYKMYDAMGTFLKAMILNIQVYKYGDGPLDDQSFIGCLRYIQSDRSAGRGIEINTFGIIRQDTRITQATVESHFCLELTDPAIFG